MPNFWELLTSPSWWASVVVVGVAINLASAYLKPVLDRWIFRRFYGAHITEPSGSALTPGFVEFKGGYHFTFGSNLAVYRFDGQTYWPQAPLKLDPTNKRWSTVVYIAASPNQDQVIILAAISDDLKVLTDYYGQVHDALGKWLPIRLRDVPSGLRELHRVTVHLRQ